MGIQLPQSVIDFFEAIPDPSEDCDEEFRVYILTMIANCDKAYTYLLDKYHKLTGDDVDPELKQICRDSALSSKAAGVMFELTLAHMDNIRGKKPLPDELVTPRNFSDNN